MVYNVLSLDTFEKQTKRLVKKYPSLKKELLNLVQDLKINPTQGTLIGKKCYKIRLSIASKGKGKSGGARIITNLLVGNKTVYILTIYDKSEKNSLTEKELSELLEKISI